MEFLRKLRFGLYPTVFIVMFLFAAYCTFPNAVVREMVENRITGVALGIGPKTRGVPVVTTKDVSLWRLSGVSLDHLKIEWPANMTSPPLALVFDEIKARLGLFSLLTANRSISASLKLYGGGIDIGAKMRGKNGLSSISVDGSKIDLSKIKFIESSLGVPLAGIMQILIDLESKTQMDKDGKGSVKLNLDNLNFGPGVVNLPTDGFVSSLTVPLMSLGKLVADFSLDQGTLTTKSFSLSGGDVEAEMKLSVILGKNPASSRLDGHGWFSVKQEFINTNETLKMLFDLIPELKASQQGDGKVGVALRGSLANPQPRLERYTGERADNTKSAVENKQDR